MYVCNGCCGTKQHYLPSLPEGGTFPFRDISTSLMPSALLFSLWWIVNAVWITPYALQGCNQHVPNAVCSWHIHRPTSDVAHTLNFPWGASRKLHCKFFALLTIDSLSPPRLPKQPNLEGLNCDARAAGRFTTNSRLSVRITEYRQRGFLAVLLWYIRALRGVPVELEHMINTKPLT